MIYFLSALTVLVFLALPAKAGSPAFNRSLYVCSAVYSDGTPTYEHCATVSDDEKQEAIETSIYDFEGGGDDDSNDDDSDDE